MLDIVRIDHIGTVVPELEPQLAFLEGLLGLRRELEWDAEGERPRGVSLVIPGDGGVRWEVIEAGDGGPLAEFVEGPRGPGVHHVTMEVPDTASATTELHGHGIEPQSIGRGELRVPADEGGQGLDFRLVTGSGEHACGGEAARSVEPTANGGPSLGVVALDHISHAAPDRDVLGGWYEAVFGMRETFRTPDGEHDDLADLVLDVPGGQMCWEVLQPVGEGSFIERFLETRGPSVHHVAFEVGDWAQALAACEAREIPSFGESEGVTDGAAWHDAFIHPRHTGGYLLQFFWEERPGAWVASDKVPSGR